MIIHDSAYRCKRDFFQKTGELACSLWKVMENVAKNTGYAEKILYKALK